MAARSSATSARPTQRVSTGSAPQLAAPCQYGAYIGWLADAAPDSRDVLEGEPRGIHVADAASVEATPGRDAEDAIREASTRLDAPTHGRPPEPRPCPARDAQHASSRGPGRILLSHLSGRDDVVFGAAFSGRPRRAPGRRDAGRAVREQPAGARAGSTGERRDRDWLAELHERNLEIAQHQYASLCGHPGVGRRPVAAAPVRQPGRLPELPRGRGRASAGARSTSSRWRPRRRRTIPLTLTVTPGDEIG